MKHTKCLIVGSGPAGYTAAIYAGRANLSPVVVCGMQMGGQLTQTTIVENFPGYPEGVDANQMMTEMQQQAARFGAEILTGSVTDVDFSARPAVATLDSGDKIEADTVIVATGASAKYLGMPDEDKYNGRGVSACATCDGFFYRKKVTAVVGGGDTACEDALYLSQLCSKVFLVVRKPFLRASKIMQERVMAAENIEILFEHNATGLYGENGVEGMHVVKRKGEPDEQHYDVAIDGFFLAIGHKPNSEVFAKWVDTDEVGYIKTIGTTQQTRTPGLFAAGDVCDPTYRQAVVAAGTGCKAALEAERYLQTF